MNKTNSSQVFNIAQSVASAIMIVIAATLWLVVPAGCDIDFSDFNPPTDNDADTNGMDGEPQDVPGPIVEVRFVNQTEQAVVADVFVSTNGNATPDAIFVEENQITDGIGLASTGVLVPESTDSVDVPCTEGMAVATTGGVFRDPDTGEDLGTGPMRILQEGLVFDCGAEITFVYRIVDGEYDVVVTLN